MGLEKRTTTANKDIYTTMATKSKYVLGDIFSESGSGEKPVFCPQNYDFFLVLDFEANGAEDRSIPMEIIEFPVLKVSGKTFEVESVFHQYVEPINPVTQFTTDITGITREMTTKQPDLGGTLERFHTWMQNENLLDGDASFIFVTCGDWDLKTQLPQETSRRSIPLPDYLKSWINIKKTFHVTLGTKGKTSMMQMLNILNIPHTGKHHSGIDDVKNIAKILAVLARKGHVYHKTGEVK